MNTIGLVIGVLAAGLLLGAAFFGGLWWTVRRGLAAANAAIWFGLSALLRMALILAALYYIARLGWAALLVCLCGMLIARIVVTRLTRNVA